MTLSDLTKSILRVSPHLLLCYQSTPAKCQLGYIDLVVDSMEILFSFQDGLSQYNQIKLYYL